MLLSSLLLLVALFIVANASELVEGSGFDEGSGEDEAYVAASRIVRVKQCHNHTHGCGDVFYPPLPHENLLLPPTFLVVSAIKDSSLKLSWHTRQAVYSAFHFVIRFRVRWEDGSYSAYLYAKTSSKDRSFYFWCLLSNSTYEFSVRISESADWSETVLARTLTSPPEIPPAFRIYASTADQNAVILYWYDKDHYSSWKHRCHFVSNVEEYSIWITDFLNSTVEYCFYVRLPPRIACLQAASSSRTSVLDDNSWLAAWPDVLLSDYGQKRSGVSEPSRVYSYRVPLPQMDTQRSVVIGLAKPSIVIKLARGTECHITCARGMLTADPVLTNELSIRSQ